MPPSLTQKSYSEIRSRLVRGDLAPGDRLVTRTLAAELGVSLAPVREALNRLASEGLVEHVPGAGAFVRHADRQDLEEIYILRDATESCAAAEAAKHITEAQLEDLDDIVDDWCSIAEAIPDAPGKHATKSQLARWLDNEERFHETLVEASRNRLLGKVIRENRAISSVFEAQRQHPGLLTREIADRTCNGRRQLMDALRQGDSDQARALMSDQIRKGKRTVLRFLRERSRDHRDARP